MLTQGDLNDFVRDLNLSKKQAELPGSRFKEWTLLNRDAEIRVFRNRRNEFKEFFSRKRFDFCKDICSVIETLGHQNDRPVSRLFLDSLKVSLKSVLLHNENNLLFLPLTRAANMTNPMKI